MGIVAEPRNYHDVGDIAHIFRFIDLEQCAHCKEYTQITYKIVFNDINKNGILLLSIAFSKIIHKLDTKTEIERNVLVNNKIISTQTP